MSTAVATSARTRGIRRLLPDLGVGPDLHRPRDPLPVHPRPADGVAGRPARRLDPDPRLHHHGPRPEHRRRASPGLLDLGYVAFYAIGAFVIGWLGSQQFPDVAGGNGIHILTRAKSAFGSDVPGIHINFFIVIFIAAAFTGDLGRDPRRPDAAPARRLPGDRHARVRRDRAARLRELDERHLRHRPHGLLQRPPGDHADRQDQPPVDDRDAQISARAETRLLRRAGRWSCS